MKPREKLRPQIQQETQPEKVGYQTHQNLGTRRILQHFSPTDRRQRHTDSDRPSPSNRRLLDEADSQK